VLFSHQLHPNKQPASPTPIKPHHTQQFNDLSQSIVAKARAQSDALYGPRELSTLSPWFQAFTDGGGWGVGGGLVGVGMGVE